MGQETAGAMPFAKGRHTVGDESQGKETKLPCSALLVVQILESSFRVSRVLATGYPSSGQVVSIHTA